MKVTVPFAKNILATLEFQLLLKQLMQELKGKFIVLGQLL